MHAMLTRLSIAAVILLGFGLARAADRPNFIIFFTDDQGYGDVGVFGAKTFKTPNFDRLAAEGTRCTSFYAQTVCGPSRTALMTARYPMRAAPAAQGWSLPNEETTVAEILHEAGYATGMVGKWDLSGRKLVPDRHPLSQGFESYFGTLGANDRGTIRMMRAMKPLDIEQDMGAVTGRYTAEAIEFIESHTEGPFFLYLAHTMPHVIIGASESFRGRSARGPYGDVIEELDDSLGQILTTLHKHEIADNTILLFCADNGPWLIKGENGGSAGPLRSGKGSAWEGGLRVPAIVWGPGRIPAGRTLDGMLSTLDVLPTFTHLAGGKVPTDRVLDGYDQAQYLLGQTDKSARDRFFYYVRDRLFAVRHGDWKLALPVDAPGYNYAPEGYPIESPQLYNLKTDTGEQHDVAAEHPDRVEALLKLAKPMQGLGNS